MRKAILLSAMILSVGLTGCEASDRAPTEGATEPEDIAGSPALTSESTAAAEVGDYLLLRTLSTGQCDIEQLNPNQLPVLAKDRDLKTLCTTAKGLKSDDVTDQATCYMYDEDATKECGAVGVKLPS